MRVIFPNSWKTPVLLVAALLAGCQSAYYGAMEKFGYEKRDILVDRVEDAREVQQDAKERFESALAQFIAVTNFSGGELEQQYNKLKSERARIQADISALVVDMNRSIAEADRFIKDMAPAKD